MLPRRGSVQRVAEHRPRGIYRYGLDRDRVATQLTDSGGDGMANDVSAQTGKPGQDALLKAAQVGQLCRRYDRGGVVTTSRSNPVSHGSCYDQVMRGK